MKKILFLAPQPFFEARGTPINEKLLVTALSELGYEVDMLTYPHGDDVQIPNVTIKRIPRIPGVGKAPIGPSKEKIIYDAVMFFYAFRMMFSKRYNVIHAVEESVFIAWVLNKVFGVSYVFDMDSHMSDQLKYGGFAKSGALLHYFKAMELLSMRRSGVVITVCQYLTDIAEKIVDKSQVVQIEDIPPPLSPPPDGVTKESLRRECKIPDASPVVLYTGNFEKYQGVELIMDSAPVIVESEPSVRFLIVGGSPKDVARYRGVAESKGLAENFVFTGSKPIELMPVFMEMADILLSPRLDGTNTPLKVYTYLASGKAIVATDLPTHTQVLTKDLAILTKPEKMEYADGVLLLLKDQALRNQLGKKGRALVEQKYNFNVFKVKLALAYRKV